VKKLRRKLTQWNIRHGIVTFPWHGPGEDREWSDPPWLTRNQRSIGIVIRHTGFIFMPLHNRAAKLITDHAYLATWWMRSCACIVRYGVTNDRCGKPRRAHVR
jgi:hypothetical protein